MAGTLGGVIQGEGRLIIDRPERLVLEPSHSPFTFGRDSSCDVCLDEDDRSISRRAGALVWNEGMWEVHNTSTTRPLYLVNAAGLRSALPVGERAPLPNGSSRIVVVGSSTHEIGCELGEFSEPSAAAADDRDDPEQTLVATITPNERIALVALVEGFILDHPRYDPRPRTYSEAASRLDLPVATVRKRIENLRLKLIKSGVVELESADARAGLAEFALATHIVTAEDLALLPEI